jgi:hypothetical protein
MSMANRRKEDRYKGEGEVRLFFEDPTRQEVNGSLLDYSNSGFRAAHKYCALHTGQVVDFRHVIAKGRARVMWNRIIEDRVETGFLVL